MYTTHDKHPPRTLFTKETNITSAGLCNYATHVVDIPIFHPKQTF